MYPHFTLILRFLYVNLIYPFIASIHIPIPKKSMPTFMQGSTKSLNMNTNYINANVETHEHNRLARV